MENGEQPKNDNPVTTAWETTDNTITKKEKHQKPISKDTTWNIKEEQAKINKYKSNSEIWLDKCKGPQAIIDKHKKEHKK